MKIGRFIGYVALAIELLALAATFVPLLKTPVWWVRVCDYPRLQLTILLIVSFASAAILLKRSRRITGVVFLAMVAGIAFNIATLFPFTTAAQTYAPRVSVCPGGNTLHILSANVEVTNRDSEALLRLIAKENPDIVLLMETDEWWHEHLAPLNSQYQYVVSQVEKGPYGIHLFSRYKLLEPEIKFFVASDNPSIITKVELPSGTAVTFIGLHPRPPARDQTSIFRDAELMNAAMIAHQSRPVVIAGDFNSVPWERVAARLERVGGFVDPRRGRSLVNTYGADDVLLRWPLDYVLFQKEFLLEHFGRLTSIGSDHFPVEARLCYAPDESDKNRIPSASAHDLEEAARNIHDGAVLAHRIQKNK